MRNETIRGNSILLAGASLYLALAFFGTVHASESGYPYPPVRRGYSQPVPIGRLAENCGPGRPCPPPPPVQRGHLPFPPPPPVQRGSDGYPTPVGYPPTTSSCPPMTVYDQNIGRCVADPYGAIRMRQTPPVLTGNAIEDADERSAANLVNVALRGLDCSSASEALRRLTNQVLQLQAMGTRVPGGPGQGPGGNDPGAAVRLKWRQHFESPVFWKKVWNHMADAYRSCNRTCFDDGISVGTLSATAYCSASVALDGLPGPGYIEQTPLPVCETATFAGCVKSYGDTANTVKGCAAYATNQYESIFAQYQSQDCHL